MNIIKDKGEALHALAADMTEVLNKAIGKSKGDPGLKQLAANISYAKVAAKGAKSKAVVSSDKITNAKFTTKSAAKPREQSLAKDEKVGVFIRGPSKPETDETVAAVARVMGAALEELQFKFNSSWSFMARRRSGAWRR
ncbi:hypothetical protein Cpir12675_000547 [Ceratocystis pirilliformis]|uniref:Uncharacterized protein n=1 Tax=Ceratocystis pirilliformis TaxID=259994 RepID=A0ABR3ZLK6_9PEZI